MDIAKLRVAIVHDWLVVYGGAERVLAELIDLFPQADIFSTVHDLESSNNAFLKGKIPTTTFIQKLPFGKKKYRSYLLLMPLAIEQLDLSTYDLVISSSSSVAKGVITSPNQYHLAYVYSPARYAWDLQHSYLKEAGIETGVRSWLARLLLHYFRIWDVRTSANVDKYVAISSFIGARIRKIYGRESQVVYPPVDVKGFTPGGAKEDFYLTASRMVPYKKIPLIAEAFSCMPDKHLIIIGDGPDMERVKALAGPNVSVLGYQSDAVVLDHMRRAKAFVFAAEEDFGIAPLEAQACGTPVIAYGRGGALETIIGDGGSPTGLFFGEQTVDSICAAIARFEAIHSVFLPENCRANAMRFSREAFRNNFLAQVHALLQGR